MRIYYEPRPEEHYPARINLQLDLPRVVASQEPQSGVTGWIGHRLGGSEKEEETLTASDFLRRVREFLSHTISVHVSEIRLGRHTIYISIEGQEDRENLEEAFSAVLDSDKLVDHNTGEVYLSVHGLTDGFVFLGKFEYLQSHPQSRAPITVDIFCSTEELWKQPDEGDFDYDDRINQIIEDKNAAATKDQEVRTAIDKWLPTLEEQLRLTFDTSDLKEQVKAGVENMVW
jgi:hypothetical protein